MKRELLAVCTFTVALIGLETGMEGAARADEARVSVGALDARDRYAEPPPDRREPPLAVDEPPLAEGRDARELYRAPFRLALGPVGVTTGRGLGVGLGVAADAGNGTVGLRLAGAWTRGEGGASAGGSGASAIADGLAQYSAELTLDLHKRGPWHPVIGVGFGLAHVNRGSGSADAGVGTGRIGLDYALAVEDADVRIGAGILGALTGPADRELSDLRAYALLATTLSIGF